MAMPTHYVTIHSHKKITSVLFVARDEADASQRCYVFLCLFMATVELEAFWKRKKNVLLFNLFLLMML